jgi:hypothetical protein
MEGTTRKIFPRKLFFIAVHFSAARRCERMYKNIDAPVLTRVWKELEYRVDVSSVVHTSNISSFQEPFSCFPVAVNNSIKAGPLAFLL